MYDNENIPNADINAIHEYIHSLCRGGYDHVMAMLQIQL